MDEPLFPRHLFIRLGETRSAQSWVPIRSTKGVHRLVCFGFEPAKMDDRLIKLLREQETLVRHEPKRLFVPGDRVTLTEGAFAGVEAIYQTADGDQRVFVLIELMNKSVVMSAALASLKKTG